MKKLYLLLAAVLVATPVQAQTALSPDQLVRQTTDELVAEMKVNRDAYAKDHNKLYKMADEKVLPHFDFTRMSQWVLGRYWKQATPEQRDRFVAQFRDLLVRTYSTALLNYTDEQINYLPLILKEADGEAVVRTEVKQKSGAPNIPIVYDFYRNKDGAWKVYDVTIEGVSLVTNYRSVYATKIKQDGIDALLATMLADADNTKITPRKK